MMSGLRSLLLFDIGLTGLGKRRKISGPKTTMISKQTIQLSASNLVFLLLIIVALAACQERLFTEPTVGNVTMQSTETRFAVTPSVETMVSASVVSTRPKPATLKPLPTETQQATLIATQIASATTLPTSIATITATIEHSMMQASTATAIALADSVDRSCPEPWPVKPDYNHYYLSGTEWPTPVSPSKEHFWLSKPLPGAGRLLYTDWLPYGYDAGGRYLLHTGVDSAEPAGTPVLAAAGGTVVVAGEDKTKLFGWRCDWYGHLVVIELDDRWQDQPMFVLYGHVLNIAVVPGQRVELGQKVAEVGVGGAASLPHLHMEVRVGSNEFGSTRNPFLWLEPPPTRGLIVGRLIDPEGRPWQGVTVAAVGRSEATDTYRTWTYLDDPQHLIKPDEIFAENFVIADVIPGEYEMYVEIQDEIYQVPITVIAGDLAEVEIITLPLRISTQTETGSQ